MKKVIFTLFCALVFSSAAFSADYDPAKNASTIGSTLLTKNGITTEVKFEVTAKEVDNSSFATDRVVSLSQDDLAYAKNDNELAYVIANSLGYIITGRASKGRLISSLTGGDTTATNASTDAASSIVDNIMTQKAQKEADVIAVNLMANAGYSPLAGIVVLTRQTQSYLNAVLGKPVNADRAMNIYDYTAYAYPDVFKKGYNCNEYKTFLTYAEDVVKERKENKKLAAKSEKELKKYRQNSVSQIKKFKTRGAMTGWDAAYGILNGTK